MDDHAGGGQSRMGLWMRLGFREIRGSWRFSLAYTLSLGLGLVGFTTLDAFKGSLEQSMSGRSKLLLGADFSVGARRELTAAELAKVRAVLNVPGQPPVLESQTIELLSMVTGAHTTRLSSIRAVDDAYPFYGQVKLSQGATWTGGAAKPLNHESSTWIAPDLAIQLGAAPGTNVRIGEATFKVAGTIADDSTDAWRGFSIAPTVMIGLSQLAATHLVQPGSSVYYSRFFRLSPTFDSEDARKKVLAALDDPGVRVSTDRTASDQVARVLGYLNDYLGLVALVALFLASLGGAYLFRSFLSGRLHEIAVLMSLGTSSRQARHVFTLQVAALGSAAALLSAGLSAICLPLFGSLVRQYLAFNLDLHLGLPGLAASLLIGSLGSVLVCWPLLNRISALKPAELFREDSQPSLQISVRGMFALLPAVAAFWGLACWQAHSWKVGSLFIGGFVGAALVLGLVALGGLRVVDRFSQGELPLRWKLVLRSLARNRLSSVSCFLSIGLGAVLMNLIPQIQRNIRAELRPAGGLALPSLFLFDIQDDQKEPLVKWLNDSGHPPNSISPMVRARLAQLNEAPFTRGEDSSEAQTRERQSEANSRNRSFNLSFREKLAGSETLFEGKWWNGPADPTPGAIPEISVERRFAERMGLKIGDRLEFDVQGVMVKGRVSNVRKVKWASFEPNFFVSFQPGALEAAPKTWLAAIPHLDATAKAELQNQLVAQFPNVSAVDVASTIEKILAMFDQMAIALRLMAGLTLAAGLAVLFAISRHQASLRKRETSLLKVLGADFKDVLSMFHREFAIIALASSLLGGVVSWVLSWGISVLIFDGVWAPAWWYPVWIGAAITLGSVVIASTAARRMLARKPLALLQEP